MDTTRTLNTEQDMETALADVLVELAEDYDVDRFTGLRVESFANTGLMTRDNGLVLRLANGAEFQLTIRQSQYADEPDEDAALELEPDPDYAEPDEAED